MKMDKDFSWKKTQEVEIDLTDWIKSLLLHWKGMVICALAAAVLLGGYSYIKSKSIKEAAGRESAEEIELKEEEQQSVAEAVQLAKEIADLENYMEQSVLMQIDPYQKNRIVLLYSIGQTSKQELQKISESYLSFLSYGGAVGAVAQADSEWDGIGDSYLAELVSAWQRADSTYRIISENDVGSIPAETLLYVEVTGVDAKMAEKLAADIQKALKDYEDEVQKVCGSHKLSLLKGEKSVVFDSSLLAQQREKKESLKSSRGNLKSMTEVFSHKQKAVYQEETGLDFNEGGQGTNAERAGVSFRYILLGVFAGVFGYCGLFACRYLMHDAIRSEKEFKAHYTIPFYGCIPVGKRQKEAERIWGRIRFMCRQQKVAKFCLAADSALSVQEKECMEQMKGKFEKWGIQPDVVEDLEGNISAWDQLADTGAVLLLCRLGHTSYATVDEQMGFYLENGIRVLGTVALDQRADNWL